MGTLKCKPKISFFFKAHEATTLNQIKVCIALLYAFTLFSKDATFSKQRENVQIKGDKFLNAKKLQRSTYVKFFFQETDDILIYKFLISKKRSP